MKSEPKTRDELVADQLEWLAIIQSALSQAGNEEAQIALQQYSEHLEEMVEEHTRELQEAQQSISDALELNRKIIAASTLGITAYKETGECILANESAGRIIGATQEQVLGQNFRSLGSWQSSGLLAVAEEALASGQERRKEVQVTSTFGRDIYIGCRFVPFAMRGVSHLLLVTDDITERKLLHERLIRHERLVTLGKLAGSVGHELRNPLGAIKNAVYFLNMVLAEREHDPEVQEALEILEREVSKSETIIGGLLDFGRAKPPVRRMVDVNLVIEETLASIGDPGKVKVIRRLDGTMPMILADPDQLSQIFENLIYNALQAMSESGQLTIETWASSVESPGEVFVSITDTGMGIPQKSLEKIFEPLFTTRGQGIGLGLTIVKTLIEGHGGTIEVESQVDKGSTFTVKLPIQESF